MTTMWPGSTISTETLSARMFGESPSVEVHIALRLHPTSAPESLHKAAAQRD